MSVQPQTKRRTAASVQALKGERPIVWLTAYTAPVAKLLDPHCDVLLVGDSVGMVVYGYESSVQVTLDMMIAHGQAVMRGSKEACIVVDLPFGAYQESKEQAFRAAARIMKETGAQAVKLEGGEEMAESVHFLSQRGIPVCGHVGLMPQLVNATGGYRSLGRSDAEADKIRRDAKAIDDAGAFAMVIEGTVEPLAREISTGRHDRHRRIGGLRRPGPGQRRHARHLHRFQAAFRQAFRQSRPGNFPCRRRLCGRGQGGHVPGRGTHLPDQAQQGVGHIRFSTR